VPVFGQSIGPGIFNFHRMIVQVVVTKTDLFQNLAVLTTLSRSLVIDQILGQMLLRRLGFGLFAA